jgi:hypothetical protein
MWNMHKEAITQIARNEKGEGELGQFLVLAGGMLGLITAISIYDGIVKDSDPSQNPHAMVTYQEMLRQSKSLEERISRESSPIQREIAPGKTFSINGLGDFHLPK